MSLLSRLFRKALPPAQVPDSARPPASADKAGAADRAAAAAADEKALQSAIDSGDVAAIARLVVEGASTKVRQAAAHAIEDADVLRQLIRDIRGGKDNNVYRILTAKRDVLAAQARKLEQVRAGIEATAAAIERHSHRPYDALFVPRLEQCERDWSAVAAQAEPGLRDQVQQWIDRSRQTIAEHERQVAEQAAREQAAAAAAAEERRLREEQQQAAAEAAAEEARILAEQQRAQAEKQDAEQQALRQVGDLIRKARGALAEGNTSRAAGARRAIEEKLAGAPPLPANLAGQLQQLDKQLQELKDWKSFSVTPKRAELIGEMEALVGAELDPQALADRIKSLQEEWRSLSKGAGENAEADWQRFHDAAQKAYEPCREFFAAQALVREENMRRREALLERLTAFEAGQDWAQPDWRGVIRTLRETKQEWRACVPIDYRAGKAQQEKFSALVESLQERLDAEYGRNVKQKESLIERAQSLLAGDDVRQAIEAVKDLQQKWQAVGPVPREADQKLWAEFRQRCDAVFQRRQQESAAHAAGLESNKAQAIALCEQVEGIAALEGTELQERARSLGELRRAFEALGELPRADARDLHRRLERALERCDQALARQRARDAEHAWSELFATADRVRAYRLAVARGVDQAQADALKAAAESAIAAVQRWPRGGLDAVREALTQSPPADLAANETALRMLCIRAELLTETPTPPEDQALRRDYQLRRLVEGMGQGRQPGETLEAMAMEWVRAGPVDDAVHAALLQRFTRCRERGGASVGTGGSRPRSR